MRKFKIDLECTKLNTERKQNVSHGVGLDLLVLVELTLNFVDLVIKEGYH